MKKINTEENVKLKISSGCQVSSLLILLVLVIEYGLFFLAVPFNRVSFLFLLGFTFITYTVTCNNHGRNVHLYYERELSLLLKGLVTDLVMGVFLYTYFSETDRSQGFGIFMSEYKWWMGYFVMILFHEISILLLCIFWNKFVYPGKKGRILYIYDKNKPGDIRSIDEEISIQLPKEELSKKINENELIYLYDISAEKRNDILKECFDAEKDVYISAKISDIQLRSSYLTQDEDHACFYCPRPGISRRAAFVKRAFDISISVLGLILTSWILGIIAIAIKLEDGGKVLYRQERCTKGGKVFYILKFRSMVEHQESGNLHITEHKDSRITKVGMFIRKFKLDELPQLVNILRGDMSLVGPRPERPELIQDTLKSIPEYNFRTTVKAGLTGYAQVHGDYHTDFLEKLRWDLIYIENYSLLLDLKIVLMTIPTLIRGSSDV